MRLMGAPMGVVTEAHAVQSIVDAAVASRGHWTITANLDHLRRYHRDPVQKGLIDDADPESSRGEMTVDLGRSRHVPVSRCLSASPGSGDVV